MISEIAWKNIMRRYDPPKKVIYDDIEIAGEGDSATLDKVSQTLATVEITPLSPRKNAAILSFTTIISITTIRPL